MTRILAYGPAAASPLPALHLSDRDAREIVRLRGLASRPYLLTVFRDDCRRKANERIVGAFEIDRLAAEHGRC